MNLLLAIVNFVLAFLNIGRALREKKPLALWVGVLSGLTSGIYGFLALKNGEIRITRVPAEKENMSD